MKKRTPFPKNPSKIRYTIPGPTLNNVIFREKNVMLAKIHCNVSYVSYRSVLLFTWWAFTSIFIKGIQLNKLIWWLTDIRALCETFGSSFGVQEADQTCLKKFHFKMDSSGFPPHIIALLWTIFKCATSAPFSDISWRSKNIYIYIYNNYNYKILIH